MQITVDFMFPTSFEPGKKVLDVDLPGKSSVGDLLSFLLEKYGETARQRLVKKSDGKPFVTFLVNGEQAELTCILSDQDKVLIIPPVAGG